MGGGSLPAQRGSQIHKQHFLLTRCGLDSLLDKVPCMIAMLGRGSILSTPDSMLEMLLFIATAWAMPLVAKTKRIDEVSRRCPIVAEVPFLWLLWRLLLNCLCETTDIIYSSSIRLVQCLLHILVLANLHVDTEFRSTYANHPGLSHRIHKEYKLAKLGRVEKSVDIIIRAKIMSSRTDVTL